MKVSVQICTFNRKILLGKCLEALFVVDFPAADYELVLVDDGSTDGTGEKIKVLQAPCRVNYLYKEHGGLAAARNLGIRNAAGEVVLFMDDDTLADPDLLKAHWEVLGAIDFTTIELWTKGGLVTCYLLFVMEIATRRVHFAGCSLSPDEAWMKQR